METKQDQIRRDERGERRKGVEMRTKAGGNIKGAEEERKVIMK